MDCEEQRETVGIKDRKERVIKEREEREKEEITMEQGKR